MKIAILAPASSSHTVKWVNGIATDDHEIHLISMHTPCKTLTPNITVHQLPIKNKIGYFTNCLALKRLLKKIQPDILHSHYASGYGTLGMLSNFHPHIISIWGSDIYDFPKHSYFHYLLLKRNLLTCDLICSTSQAMAEQCKKLYPTIKRIKVIPFGIDTNHFSPDQRKKTNKQSITIGTVKSLDDKYGIDLLIKSFASANKSIKNHPETENIELKLMIIGEGPKKNDLIKLTKELNIEHQTTFIGQIQNSQVPTYLRQLDIFVALSRCNESFGVAILEASACALPVIVSRTDGFSEIVIHKTTGLIVDRNNPNQAAENITSLITDSTWRNNLGNNGRNHVVKFYRWNENLKSMLDTYKIIHDCF